MSGSHRLLPSSFDPEDASMHGIPVPLDWRWSSVEKALQEWGSRGVMMRLPLFWQLEVPLFHACRAADAFLFTNDVGNIPLGIEAVRIANIDTIVTTFDDAALFTAQLAERNVSLSKQWVIIRTPSSAKTPLPQILRSNDLRVFEEIHITPGIAA